MKKILSLIVSCTLILLCFHSTAYASREGTNEMDSFFQDAAYIESEAIRYLTKFYKTSEDHNYSVSQGFFVHGGSEGNYRLYFIFEDEKCIGRLACDTVNGSFQSACLFEDSELITRIYTNKEGIVLAWSEEGLVVIYNNGAFLEDKKVDSIDNYRYSSPSETIVLHTLDFDLSGPRAIIVESGTVNIPVVANAISPDTSAGLCWAASSASIINYYTGNSYSALSLYSTLKAYYPPSSYGYPDSSFVERAFAIHSLGLTHHFASNYYTLKTVINQGKPIYTGFAGHAIVVCGYMLEEGGHYYYDLMDPNCSNKFWYQISNPSSAGFTYVAPSGTTYNATNLQRMFW